MKRFLFILLPLFFIHILCKGQFKRQLDSLCIECNNKITDSDKVIALGKIADLYYWNKLNHQGDSVLHRQLEVAEASDNDNLILAALFGNSITNISSDASKETFDQLVDFVQKGIDYAKSQNQYNYIALGYTRMANIYRKRGQYDKALYNATQAIQFLPNIHSDSLQAIIYIELGNAYQAKGEAVSACRSYNNAYDLALKLKSIPLQSDLYHNLSEIYCRLGDTTHGKEQLKKSLALDKKGNYHEGIIRDYYDLARLTNDSTYILKTIYLSNEFHNNKYLLLAKRLMFYYYMVVVKNSDRTLQYLQDEPDVNESYLNSGLATYDQMIGDIYYYGDKFDSALYYFKMVEYEFVNHFDIRRTRNLFKEIANTNKKLNDFPNAIAYFTKAYALSTKMNDMNDLASTSSALSFLYEQVGDYKQAYTFQKISSGVSESLQNLSKGSEVALLDVERENRKHADELKEEEQRENNSRNIQYMAISVAIVVVFILMLVIGTFPVSKMTIRMLGYFFFISLFEFIVMIIDNSLLAKAVHNEPLKLWLIKIGLIALLVPIQHFLEHNLIKFLQSRKLLEAKSRFSVKKWWRVIKKPAPVEEAGIEEDTAVL